MENTNINVKNWKSLIKPGKLDINLNDDKSFAKITAEPLEKGYGLTLGNSLRRILLSSIRGTAVTAIQIDGVLHEFTSIKGVREDVTDIVLNVKSLALKSSSDDKITWNSGYPHPGYIYLFSSGKHNSQTVFLGEDAWGVKTTKELLATLYSSIN